MPEDDVSQPPSDREKLYEGYRRFAICLLRQTADGVVLPKDFELLRSILLDSCPRLFSAGGEFLHEIVSSALGKHTLNISDVNHSSAAIAADYLSIGMPFIPCATFVAYDHHADVAIRN